MKPRQRRFAEEYAACGNAAEAARRAGYSPKRAKQTGRELLANPEVRRLVAEFPEEHAGQLGVDKRFVAAGYAAYHLGAQNGRYPPSVGVRGLEGLSRLLGFDQPVVVEPTIVFVAHDPNHPDPDVETVTMDFQRDLDPVVDEEEDG